MSHLPAAIVQEVEAIVARARTTAIAPEDETRRIRSDIADLPSVRRDGLTYYFQEWVMHVGRGSGPTRELDMLARVQPLQLHCAPEHVATIPTTEGYVSILRYSACPGETLIPAESSQQPFTPAASDRLRAEIQRVLDLGFYHSAARGFIHWWIAQPSGTIVLDSWAALQPCPERERANQLAIIDLLLDERSTARFRAFPR